MRILYETIDVDWECNSKLEKKNSLTRRSCNTCRQKDGIIKFGMTCPGNNKLLALKIMHRLSKIL
jgi:hypothetical protein